MRAFKEMSKENRSAQEMRRGRLGIQRGGRRRPTHWAQRCGQRALPRKENKLLVCERVLL